MTVDDAKVKAMGSFLSRMTESAGESTFSLNDNQVTAVIEVLIKRIVEAMPGMPAGMKCSIVEKDDAGWTIRIDKPDRV